jgi:hypothetical protein
MVPAPPGAPSFFASADIVAYPEHPLKTTTCQPNPFA